jgi:hypothetical protein
MRMNRMDQQTLRVRLAKLSESLQRDQSVVENMFEKISIALASVFRLTQGNQTTLKALQGSPQEVQGYVINLITETRKKIDGMNERTTRDLDNIILELEMSPHQTESSKR